MKHILRLLSGALLAAALVPGAGTGIAAAQTPGTALPQFSVASPAGEPIASDALTAEGQWLLVYLDPVTAPNSRLVGLLKAWQTPQLIARVVLVVDGKPSDVKRWLAKELGDQPPPLAWFADVDGSAGRALKAIGTPMLLGVRAGNVEWTLTGILSRVESLESIVRTWVETAGGVRP